METILLNSKTSAFNFTSTNFIFVRARLNSKLSLHLTPGYSLRKKIALKRRGMGESGRAGS